MLLQYIIHCDIDIDSLLYIFDNRLLDVFFPIKLSDV